MIGWVIAAITFDWRFTRSQGVLVSPPPVIEPTSTLTSDGQTLTSDGDELTW